MTAAANSRNNQAAITAGLHDDVILQAVVTIKRDGEIDLGVAVHVGLDDGLVQRPDIAEFAGLMVPFA